MLVRELVFPHQKDTKKRRVILMRDYIFDTEGLKNAWGEEKG